MPPFHNWITSREDQTWWTKIEGFFADKGYVLRRFKVMGGTEPPEERCLLAGYAMAPNGALCSHLVVGEHGRIVWDPHPLRPGLATVEEVWMPGRAE